ncbi:DUF1778 domain-containing protein [Halochromatium salexigens]|uniref:type II toxin-antitoxin system TacA family antitoxin n=1 Tax=Halochromatium salexigens TaxID=49447 RepID=UPI003B8347F8
MIDQAANLLGKNRSDFMLEAACERAQSVPLDQVYFQREARSARPRALERQETSLCWRPRCMSADGRRYRAVSVADQTSPGNV